MFARSILLCSLLALALAGCSASNDYMGGPSGDGDSSGARLENEGMSTLDVLPNNTYELRVRYLDEASLPVAGMEVEFSFLGLSGSAFLPSERPVTDLDGRAVTTLSVGSNPPESFMIRVSAANVEPLFLTVNVADAMAVKVIVSTPYKGKREVVARTVSKLADTTCDDALEAGVAGEAPRTIEGDHQDVEFELAPGVRYAMLGWGRDPTNAIVTRGCVEVVAPNEAEGDGEPLRGTAELMDIPMMPTAGLYPFTMDLDVGVSVQRLQAAMDAKAEANFPAESLTQGQAFVAALEAELSDRMLPAPGESEASAAAESIEAALAADGKGLVAYGKALSARTAELGSHLRLSGGYGIGAGMELPMSIAITMVRARNADDTVTLVLSKSADYMVPTASVQASYSDSYAALDVQTLSLQQSLGSYGEALVSALVASEGPTLALMAGCDVAGPLLEQAAPACDAECQVAVCERALGSLRSSLTEFASFDVSHPNIGLRGLILTRDRSGDGLIDDVGPAELDGNWGMSEQSDVITATVHKPVQVIQ